MTRPVRGGWAVVAAYAWFAAYVWVGLLLASAAVRFGDGPGVGAWVVGLGGGLAMGAWQAGHRLRRHREPGTPPLDRVGLALLTWLALLGLVLWAGF